MSNPSLNEERIMKDLSIDGLNDAQMTIGGTINKSFVLVGVTLAMALIAVNALLNNIISVGLITPALIIGLIIAFVTVFKPKTAPVTAPLYAMVEGAAIGLLSYFFEMQFPGIVFQAIAGTFLCFFVMLFCFKTKLIQATEKFRSTILVATFAIMILYLVNMIASFVPFLNFLRIPMINDSTLIGIAFSVIVCIVAALNFIIDFDNIEQFSKRNLPKYFEWYFGFSLLVTLIWLYVEILRLLAKLRDR